MCAAIFGRDSSSNLLAGNVSLEILCFFLGGEIFLVTIFLQMFGRRFPQSFLEGVFPNLYIWYFFFVGVCLRIFLAYFW